MTYLQRYAASLDVEIRTATRVTSVETAEGNGFLVRTAVGESIEAAGVVAASGSFGNPYLPSLPGQEDFAGEVLHSAAYREPKPYAGKRVVVVGGGNSAVQIGYELVDVVIFATGYRPHLDYLRSLGALDASGAPLHTGGISGTHPGLVYVGLEFQRSFSSNTLRGAARDAEHVATPLAAYVRGAAALVSA